MTETSLVWLRQDLRLADQPALAAAAEAGVVIPVFVLDDETPGPRCRMGGAQRWWLHGSLERLAVDLEAVGSRLVLRRGRADVELVRLAEEVGATGIHALRHAEPWWRKIEEALGDRLTLHDGNNLAPLRHIVTGGGQPYRIYSAFWRALQMQMPPPPPLPAPTRLAAPERWPHSDSLDSWALRPTRPDWATGFDMVPGEAEAARRLSDFVDRVDEYEVDRNLPGSEGTSRLSPHLHFGEISPATVWHGVEGQAQSEKFRKELAWRDFTQGVTLALSDYARTNGNRRYDALGWRQGPEAEADLRAWQQGRTGYPIVDAGMRQLWATGWMHNRVRMITASFLVKHLLIDWRRGWEWYWDTLLDADYGNNSVNWQWVAGTGVDANMFSRIMAPLVQSEKFDAGDYIRAWVPELAGVRGAAIHDPGPVNRYPAKIVEHREGRERALAAARMLR
ncbi:cryptochrome/photolyase family protein [Sphingomonas sp. M1-B02]|uniref:cryptochrome/photolyase family protein n=1 Tax=Sphingomonas sp. M1-B02 TaxID=3114300 RepID=UPI00223EE56D|nr:deoxyribodipyrimidine photo-lyase [Sphingomonas sp. S6-11]UZK66328.1 DNA photolyase family protein [Sphingomonas sp. S6-11]